MGVASHSQCNLTASVSSKNLIKKRKKKEEAAVAAAFRTTWPFWNFKGERAQKNINHSSVSG